MQSPGEFQVRKVGVRGYIKLESEVPLVPLSPLGPLDPSGPSVSGFRKESKTYLRFRAVVTESRLFDEVYVACFLTREVR